MFQTCLDLGSTTFPDSKTVFVLALAPLETVILIFFTAYIMIYKGENLNKSILAIIFYRINILTSSLLLCAAFLVLFQGTPHMTMVEVIFMVAMNGQNCQNGHFWPFSPTMVTMKIICTIVMWGVP